MRFAALDAAAIRGDLETRAARAVQHVGKFSVRALACAATLAVIGWALRR